MVRAELLGLVASSLRVKAMNLTSIEKSELSLLLKRLEFVAIANIADMNVLDLV